MFVEEDAANITLQGSIICDGCRHSVCEDPELGAFVFDAGSRSKSCLSVISALPGLIAVRFYAPLRN